VITQTSGAQTSVASRRPPEARSRTATSTCRAANSRNAAAVISSKNVGASSGSWAADGLVMRTQAFGMGDDGVVGQRDAIDLDAFADGDEVRTRVEPRATAVRALDRFDHRAGRPLAVGAGDMEARRGALGMAQTRGEQAHAFDAEARAQVTQSRQPAERLGGRHGRGGRAQARTFAAFFAFTLRWARARSRLARRDFISLRWMIMSIRPRLRRNSEVWKPSGRSCWSSLDHAGRRRSR
jgi:hypothetical protein